MTGLLSAALAAAFLTAPGPVPAHTRLTLDNGVEVVLRPERQSPWLEVHLAVRAGANADPAGKEGLASLVAGLMTAGVAAEDDAPALDEGQLSDALATLGASLHASVDRHSLVVSGAMPTFDAAGVGRFLGLLRRVALSPALSDAHVARDRGLRAANIDRLTAQHATIAEAALRQLVHGDTPDGRPDFGTLTSVEGLKRDDVVRWHRRVMTPAHAVLVIGGSFEEAPLRAWLTRHLGAAGWPARGVRCEPAESPLITTARLCARLCDADGCLANPSALPLAAPSVPAPRRLLVTVEAENASQIQWRLGFQTPVRLDHADYGPLRMGFHLLGGDFTSRLNQVLRVREGLTYGAYAQADFGGPRPDLAVVRSDAPPTQLTRAIGLARDLVAGMRAGVFPASPFASMQQNLRNTFPFRFESLPATLSQLRFLAVHGVPTTWLEGWADTVTGVSAEAVRDAFARHIPADGGATVVVGPASLHATLEADGSEWTIVSAAELLAYGLHAALRREAAPVQGPAP
jgi:zinc protease